MNTATSIRAARGQPGAPTCRASAFTLVEIAIAIGVIGFALVAIIGILPTGLQVQRDNRTETIINQDGTYWLEAIRNGARGLDVARYVDRIEITDLGTGATKVYNSFGSGAEVIGLLSHQAANTNEEARAWVWAISGSAAEKDPSPANRELTFKYRMTVHIERATNFVVSFTALSTNVLPQVAPPLDTLCQLSVTLAYPLGPKDTDPTPRRQTYRTLVSRNVETNNVGGNSYYFFTP